MSHPLEAIDEVRKRTKCSYEEAKDALDLYQGDVLNAIIYLEREEKVDKGAVKKVANKVKSLIDEGFISQIQIVKNDEVIFDFPVPVGVVLLVFWTGAFATALLVAIALKYDVKIVKRDGSTFCVTEVTAEKLSQMFDTIKSEAGKIKSKIEDKKECDSDCKDDDEDDKC